jgi:hypothetical protein
MAILAYLCKRSSMPLDGLTDSTVPAIQLHSTLHLERGRVCRIARYSNEDKVQGDSIVDYLSTGKDCMSVEYFPRWGCLVCDSVGHHPDCGFGHPFPEYILIVDVRIDLLLHVNVENL